MRRRRRAAEAAALSDCRECLLAAYGLSFGLYVAAHERNPYGASKWAALENLFEEARDLSPAPVAVLRSPPFNIA